MIWLLFACDPGPSLQTTALGERLGPCPDSPNCVCSEPGTDAAHLFAPLPLGERATAMERLHALVTSLPRATIVEERPDYLHVSVTTRWMRYTDDVELRIDAASGLVHLRSASRIGYGDMGVNRARASEIASLWAALP